MSHQVKGALSQNSRSASFNDFGTGSGEEIADAELIQMVNDLKREIKIINLENEILESTIMRIEPSLMNGVEQAIEYISKLQSNTSSSLPTGSFIKSQNSRIGLESLSVSKLLSCHSRLIFPNSSKASTRKIESSVRLGNVLSGTGPKINVLEKSELVSAEMEILIKKLVKTRNKAAKEQALLKAQLEENDIKNNDIEKAVEMFKQNVIVNGWDPIAKRIPAEEWVSFMKEWMKISDKQVSKLMLRISTTNSIYHKLKSQIKIKADLSESLRAVDFEKVAIENRMAQSIIDQKFQQLDELKALTGDANLNVTLYKKSLMEQNSYLNSIISNIKEKEKDTLSLIKTSEVIETQVEVLERKLKDMKQIRNKYEVPDIMDYVKVKAELTDLNNSVKLLENRAKIHEIALSSLNKQLCSRSQDS